MVRRFGFVAALVTAWAGCMEGGQTGQPSRGGIPGQPTNECDLIESCGPCWRNQQDRALGADTSELGRRWEGTYHEPFYWVSGPDPRIANLDPSAASTTELEVRLARKAGPARGFATCPGAAWVPMELSLRTSDGRLDDHRTVWLSVRTEQGTLSGIPEQTADANLAFQVLDETESSVPLSGGQSLTLYGTLDGALRGFVSGQAGVVGMIHTLCGGAFQLGLSERPDAVEYDGVPTPSAALSQLEGQRFSLRWSDGSEAALTTQLQATSQTACWDGAKEPIVRFDGLLRWVDDSGARVAETPVTLRTSRFAADWPTPALGCAPVNGFALGDCSVFRAWGGGFIRALSDGNPVANGDFGVASLPALLGSDSAFAQGGFARFSLDLTYQSGEFTAARLALDVSGPNAGDEERTAVSGD